MKRLALYPHGVPRSALEDAELSVPDSSCTKCDYRERVRHVCMKPERAASTGGVLIVGEKPTRLEDTAGKPFYGQHHQRVREMVKKWAREEVSYDYALKCAAGAKKIKPKNVEACRSYLAHTFEHVAPSRVIVLGPEAAFAVLGRRVQGLQVRRAYGWTTNCLGDHIPVFVMTLPDIAFQNPFSRKDFESDLQWALSVNVEPWFVDTYTKLVETRKHARIAARSLLSESWITYDVETFGRVGNKDFRIESLTVLGHGNTSFTWTREALQDPRCVEPLKVVFEEVPIATQNGKYDDRSAQAKLGLVCEHIFYDTRLGHKLLYPDLSAKLDVLAEMVGMGGHKQEAGAETKKIKAELNRQAFPLSEFTPKGNRRKIKPPAFYVPPSVLKQLQSGEEPDAFMFGFLEPKTLYRYNARDVFSTREVTDLEKPVLEEHPTIHRAWKYVVRDANKAVRYIENWGFPVDRTAVMALASRCDTRLKEIEISMRKHTDINPASPVQLAKYLYDELGLPSYKQTDSGARSTDEESLSRIASKHPYVALLLEHRKLSKFSGTYAHGLLRHIRDDGRVHGSFLLDGAGTGRLSSQEPNLQNIPRAKGSELGKMARDCFVSRPGWVLLEADYSQLELRVAAFLSGDTEMIADFQKGIDIHSNGARLCCEVAWKIPRAKWDKMTKDEQDPYRSQVKSIIFGKLYGKFDKSLAAEFGVSVNVVTQINRMIWGRYKKLEEFMERCIRESRKTGTAWTWWDGARSRVRPIPKILDQDPGMRAHYERTAGNTSVQGSAADFCTASLHPIVQWLLTDKRMIGKGELVSTVHDAVILHVKEATLDHASKNLARIMTSHNSNGVPLVVDQKWGYAWGSMQNLEAA